MSVYVIGKCIQILNMEGCFLGSPCLFQSRVVAKFEGLRGFSRVTWRFWLVWDAFLADHMGRLVKFLEVVGSYQK